MKYVQIHKHDQKNTNTGVFPKIQLQYCKSTSNKPCSSFLECYALQSALWSGIPILDGTNINCKERSYEQPKVSGGYSTTNIQAGYYFMYSASFKYFPSTGQKIGSWRLAPLCCNPFFVKYFQSTGQKSGSWRLAPLCCNALLLKYFQSTGQRSRSWRLAPLCCNPFF